MNSIRCCSYCRLWHCAECTCNNTYSEPSWNRNPHLFRYTLHSMCRCISFHCSSRCTFHWQPNAAFPSSLRRRLNMLLCRFQAAIPMSARHVASPLPHALSCTVLKSPTPTPCPRIPFVQSEQTMSRKIVRALLPALSVMPILYQHDYSYAVCSCYPDPSTIQR
jgi:hypothetical protein